MVFLEIDSPLIIESGSSVNINEEISSQYSQNVEDKIFMAADPFCKFTKAIGAEVDKSAKGLGIRSARYTMLTDNQFVKIIKEEDDTGTCEISAAESFINNI